MSDVEWGRNADILEATINGEPYDEEPQSRIEELLLELKQVIEQGGGGGGSVVTVDVLYNNAEGAAHATDIELAHSIFDYDLVMFKVSNPSEVSQFNAYTQQAFAPLLYASDEKWSIQALYGTRVVEITFAEDGSTFKIVRTEGDYDNNTVYKVVGIKHGTN